MLQIYELDKLLFKDIKLPKFMKKDCKPEVQVKKIPDQEPAFLNLIQLQRKRTRRIDSLKSLDPDLEEKKVNIQRRAAF